MGDLKRDQDQLCVEVRGLLSKFASFGETPAGGVSRLAASPDDGRVRDFLIDWLDANGFDVRIDVIGNIFGSVALENAGSDRAFFCGSHLDTQPEGGRFDGALGVACACVAGLAIRDAARRGDIKPEFGTYVLSCWTSEEGARFQPSLLGSGAFAGHLSAKEALAKRDIDGISLGEALAAIGYAGCNDIPRPDAYFEMHVEQGSSLVEAGVPVGIVTSCWGAVKLQVQIVGRADHTGPTPMNRRKDALLAAAKIVVMVRALSDRASSVIHSSVSRIETSPNSPNTVTDRVSMWIELRSGDTKELANATAECEHSILEIATETRCEIQAIGVERREAVAFDAAGISNTENALNEAEIPLIMLPTIAGHDAIRLQAICPATLIFVPSKDGISHSPDEFTSDHDIDEGFKGMLQAITSLISLPTSTSTVRSHNA